MHVCDAIRVRCGLADVAEVVANPANFSCIKYVDRFGVRWAFVYYIVALVWNSEIVLAAQHFIVAGAASVWYFERCAQST